MFVHQKIDASSYPDFGIKPKQCTLHSTLHKDNTRKNEQIHANQTQIQFVQTDCRLCRLYARTHMDLTLKLPGIDTFDVYGVCDVRTDGLFV